jgi:iron(III) transport system ATP-binding protein
MQPPDISLKNIAMSYAGSPVLRDVSLYVPGGVTTALLGPSGCGKTTLLRIVAGLEQPDSGSVTVGRDLLVDDDNFVPPERRRIGMVFQDGALFPHMSVAGNVGYGLNKAEIAAGRIQEALRMVELEGFEARSTAGLSGGQAQRVALARALAPRPDLLLLDEPFSSLDAELRVRVRADLIRLLEHLGVTTVFVTHDQEEAFVVGERLAVMRNGRIIQEDVPAEIYERPATAWLAGFVGDANLLAASSHGDGAMTDIGVVPTDRDLVGEGTVLVRPEFLQLSEGTAGVIESVEFYGHDTAYRVGGFGTTLSVRELRAPRFRVGDRVGLAYAGRAAVVFPEQSI